MNSNSNKTNTFTVLGRCTPVGQQAPPCPNGWESVGMLSNCTIGAVPGDGPSDSWRIAGYQRVCKRKVETSGDLAVDCCSDLQGISGSLECATAGWKPYSWSCNNVMQSRCTQNSSMTNSAGFHAKRENLQKDPLRHNWNGVPLGQAVTGVEQPCNGYKKYIHPDPTVPKTVNDAYCQNYLRNAPANNYFYNHDYTDYPRDFPRYSYTTPQFADEWGYQPMRTPYYSYNYWQWKDRNSYCRQFGKECNS